MRCSHAVDRFILKTGPLKGEEVIVDGPEYETAAGMGGNCGCFDPDVVLEANFYCDHYGIDTIGVSTTIAFLMECYDMRNLIRKEQASGFEVGRRCLFRIIHLIAQEEEFGKIAGQGIRRVRNIL